MCPPGVPVQILDLGMPDPAGSRIAVRATAYTRPFQSRNSCSAENQTASITSPCKLGGYSTKDRKRAYRFVDGFSFVGSEERGTSSRAVILEREFWGDKKAGNAATLLANYSSLFLPLRLWKGHSCPSPNAIRAPSIVLCIVYICAHSRPGKPLKTAPMLGVANSQ